MAALNSFSACERKRVFTVGGRQRQRSCAVIGGHSPAPVGPAERPGWPSEETQGVGYCLSPPPTPKPAWGGATQEPGEQWVGTMDSNLIPSGPPLLLTCGRGQHCGRGYLDVGVDDGLVVVGLMGQSRGPMKKL